MSKLDLLKSIRNKWIMRNNLRMARGEGTRSSFEVQLQRFFDLLLQAVELGDPEWLNGILDDWISARPHDATEGSKATIPLLLQEMMLSTFEILGENLPAGQALEVARIVLPVFSHAFIYTSAKEASLHINRMAKELDEIKQTMEQLDKSKSDFIAIAAHELKTPLTLIEGYAAMLKEQSETKGIGNYNLILLDGIGKGTHRLREIVNDMIDVSMIDNNLLALTFQPVWLYRLFDILQLEFEQTLKERNLTFTIQAFDGDHEMTFADPERLLQAFRNIMSNAIKFTPNNGRITLSGRKLPGFIELTIRDTGIGIDPQYHDIIFEKFSRLGETSLHSSGKTKYKGGGPGLGLPITKGIIEAHGGTIWVESESHDEKRCPGTIVHILLPIHTKPPDDKLSLLFQMSEKTKAENPAKDRPSLDRKELNGEKKSRTNSKTT